MTDVSFLGMGTWYEVDTRNNQSFKTSELAVIDGIFQLNELDEMEYSYTQQLPANIGSLIYNHDKDCYILIDTNRKHTLTLCLATPHTTTVLVKNNISLASLKRMNDWAEVIQTMADCYLKKFDQLPNKKEGWEELWNNSEEYQVIKDTFQKKPVLRLKGVMGYLNRDKFNRRWARYIRPSPAVH